MMIQMLHYDLECTMHPVYTVHKPMFTPLDATSTVDFFMKWDEQINVHT